MNFFPVRVRRSARLILFSSLMFSEFVAAQTCLTAADMDEPARNAVVSAAKKYFDMAAEEMRHRSNRMQSPVSHQILARSKLQSKIIRRICPARRPMLDRRSC